MVIVEMTLLVEGFCDLNEVQFIAIVNTEVL